MPAIDDLVLGELFFLIPVMRHVVMAGGHAVEKAEAHVADRVPEHECRDARSVGLEGHRDHVEHQADMLGMTGRCVGRHVLCSQASERTPRIPLGR